MTQRPLNSSYPRSEGIARDGAPKRTVQTIPTVPGQKRQTVGDLAPYHHGVSVDDTPNTVKTFEQEIMVHPTAPVTASQTSGRHVRGQSDAILKDAARLGKPPEKA